MEAAALPDKLAVTNGGSAKQRLLLRNAAVQLEDEWGNAAGGGGVQVGGRAGGWVGREALPCWEASGRRRMLQPHELQAPCVSVPHPLALARCAAGCAAWAATAAATVAAPTCRSWQRRAKGRRRRTSAGGPSLETCPSQRARVGGLQVAWLGGGRTCIARAVSSRPAWFCRRHQRRRITRQAAPPLKHPRPLPQPTSHHRIARPPGPFFRQAAPPATRWSASWCARRWGCTPAPRESWRPTPRAGPCAGLAPCSSLTTPPGGGRASVGRPCWAASAQCVPSPQGLHAVSLCSGTVACAHPPRPAPRFAHIERLNQQRGELAARRDELAQRLGGAAQALEGAHQEQQRAQQARGAGHTCRRSGASQLHCAPRSVPACRPHLHPSSHACSPGLVLTLPRSPAGASQQGARAGPRAARHPQGRQEGAGGGAEGGGGGSRGGAGGGRGGGAVRQPQEQGHRRHRPRAALGWVAGGRAGVRGGLRVTRDTVHELQLPGLVGWLAAPGACRR